MQLRFPIDLYIYQYTHLYGVVYTPTIYTLEGKPRKMAKEVQMYQLQNINIRNREHRQSFVEKIVQL
jgi:hypothetical protein